MQEAITNLISSIDKQTLTVVIVVLVAIVIVTLIKKAIKLAVFVIAVTLVASMLLPAVNSFQEKYDFKVEDGVAVIITDNQEHRLDIEKLESITFDKLDKSNEYEMVIMLDSKPLEITIPSFMVKGIEKFAESQDIKIEHVG